MGGAGAWSTRLDDERAIAALAVSHRRAAAPAIRLDQMLPDRIVVSPREASRASSVAILSACSDAGLSPTLTEMPGGDLRSALLGVASGAGVALVPASAAERYLVPSVRLVPLADPQPAVASAGVTRRGTTHLPTTAFLRRVSQVDQARRTPAIRVTVAATP